SRRSLDRRLREPNLPGLLRSAYALETVARGVKGRVGVAVVADLEVRIGRQFAGQGRVDLGPHSGHEDGRVNVVGLEVREGILVDPDGAGASGGGHLRIHVEVE